MAEKLNHLSIQQGKERIEVERLSAGDIGSVAKLKDTHTGDTFCRRDHPVRLPPIPFPEAVATSAVLVKQRGEEDKLAAGLHKLHEEDPTFHFEYSSELGQTLIHGMGERHFETLLGRLARKYGVHAELIRPRVAYRETIKGKAEGQGKHKKQTGGRGQFGDCWVRLSPLPRGRGLRVRGQHRGRRDPQQVHPGGGQRDPGVGRAGVVAGYPMVDFRAECYDGSYHDVDSNEMSFKMAGILAFRNVAPKCRPVLLEPLGRCRGLDPGRRAGRRDGRPQRPARPDPRHRAGRPAHQGPGDPSRGRAVPLLHHAALDHPRPRHPPPEVPRLRGGTTRSSREGGGREREGAGRGLLGRS